jgi:hypothetical protein
MGPLTIVYVVYHVEKKAQFCGLETFSLQSLSLVDSFRLIFCINLAAAHLLYLSCRCSFPVLILLR